MVEQSFVGNFGDNFVTHSLAVASICLCKSESSQGYVPGSPYKTSINKLYHNAGVLMINDLFRLSLAKFVFKLHHKMSLNNTHVENITLMTALHNHHTRQAKNKNYFLSNTLTSH